MADHLDYDRSLDLVHLQGAALVKDSTWTIKGDELGLDLRRRLARSPGFVIISDSASAASGASGEFNLADHSGRLDHASAGHGDWRVHAGSMTVDAKRRLHYADADFTSCSYDPKPHFHFHAGSMDVVPGQYLFARNVVFVLGKMPLFYTPFLYKSLNVPQGIIFRVQPGYDHRNGGFLRTTLELQESRTWRSKLFLDYYSTEGVGLGAEVSHRAGNDSRGILSGYEIKEAKGGAERWFVSGDVYQAFASSFAAQVRLQAMSDPNFNNNYSRASPFPITSYLLNSDALVYRLPRWTTRLSYARLDNALSDSAFTKATEDLPRLDVQSAQLRIGKLPWLNTLTGFADSNYDSSRGFQQKSLGGSWEATQSYTISRHLKFMPRLRYSETFYDRDTDTVGITSTTLTDVGVGRYLGAGTLRVRTPMGDTDLTETYSRRLKADSFVDDTAAVDHGVESNLMTVQHAYRPGRAVLVRVNSGYDFRLYRNQALGWRDRVQPIVSEVYYTPRSEFSLILRDDYRLVGGNENLVVNATWGDERKTFLSAGTGYNISNSNRYFINTEAGWLVPGSHLRLTGALRSVALSNGGLGNLHGGQLFDKELMVFKEWHDFVGRFGCRFRPGNVKEATVRVDIKLGSFEAEHQKAHDWESEWFPERAYGKEDRP